MFGRYFGSSQFQSIFGPLMQAGAKNFSLMADTALHLFDAMGVLGRAAIPLVGWMVRGVDAASRWADAFVRSKDATGGLSGAMDQAKQSLQLVGNLFGALAKAVYELGAALYPISKVAVKDLTNGLTFLAGVFQRNRQEIQNIVGGALAAFVSMVKGAWPVVSLLAKAIKNVADNIGGWKVAFELILGGVLIAKLAALFKAIKSIGVAIGLLPAEAKTAQLLIDGELVTIGTTAEVTAGKIGGIRAALMGIAGSVVPVVIALSVVNKSNLGQAELDKAGLGFLGHLPVAGNALTQVASIPGVGTTLAMAGAMGPTAYGHLTAAGGTKSQTQTHTTITGPGSGGPHPVGWGQTASIPSVPSIFSGKSTKGESSTLVAALEGISQLYKNAKINVLFGLPFVVATAGTLGCFSEGGTRWFYAERQPDRKAGNVPARIRLGYGRPDHDRRQVGSAVLAASVRACEVRTVNGQGRREPRSTCRRWNRHVDLGSRSALDNRTRTADDGETTCGSRKSEGRSRSPRALRQTANPDHKRPDASRPLQEPCRIR